MFNYNLALSSVSSHEKRIFRNRKKLLYVIYALTKYEIKWKMKF